MSDPNNFRQPLAEAETALKNLKLQKLELERQIKGLEYVVQVYRELVYKRPEDSPVCKAQDINRPTNSHRLGSKTDRRVSAIRQILTEHGSVPKATIVKNLQGLGLVGPDEQKAGNIVSGVLSSSKEFVTDHKGNWSLVPTENMEEAMVEA
jgi:hypothetical protein